MLPSSPVPGHFGVLALVVLTGAGARADQTQVIPLAGGKAIHLLAGPEARAAILEDQRDPFYSLLTVIDCEVRLAEPLPDVSAPARVGMVKKLFRDAVTEFTPAESAAIIAACRALAARIEPVCPEFIPREWKFVRTDGSEEASAAYTRADAIVLPAAKLADGLRGNPGDVAPALARLIAHESSHVFTRQHPEARERLYARLGFRHVGKIDVGEWLGARWITNPDGPTCEHVVRLRGPNGVEFDGALVIYSAAERYSPTVGRNLFAYLRTGIAVVDEEGGKYRVRVKPGGEPVLFSLEEVQGFYEQVGRNTRYVIHPDEILAENLALAFTRDLPGMVPASPVAQVPDEALLVDLTRLLTLAR